MSSFIPDSAPFNEEQRAWLNGFFAGLTGVAEMPPGAMQAAFDSVNAAGLIGGTAVLEREEDELPWHDSSLPIVDRMELAKDKPLEQRLMAAMAQLDCGSCGYVCQSYGEAIAAGQEKNLTLCSPGGKETKQMLKRLVSESMAGGAAPGARRLSAGSVDPKAVRYSRQNPYSAKLIESRLLSRPGSAKDVRHVAIDLAGSALRYEVGDALGVYPENCSELVDAIIQELRADAGEVVTSHGGERKSLKAVLAEDCCLKDPTDELVQLLIERVPDSAARDSLKATLDAGVEAGVDVLEWLQSHECLDVTAQELVSALGPLQPRLYSIASSMKQVGEEVHLTVGKVSFERHGRLRKGVASTQLADRLSAGDKLRVFVQPNHGGFTVPSDSAAPMIMVGPGTGIAPFMAFLQERTASGATGDHWLFFGDQHEACDFLYEQELRQYQRSGALGRLDTAFSRDGGQKVYVQNRMREKAAELWRWLERGAYFYVCGDASRMAKDVEQTLVAIVGEQGGMSVEASQKYVKALMAAKRYVKDVY